MKKLLSILSVTALALSGVAHAASTKPILFDADGAGTRYTPTLIDILDWAPGNALSVGGGNLAANPITQLLYQANLFGTSYTNPTTGVTTTPSLSCNFFASCLTAVAGFQESVTFSGATANFKLANPVTAPTTTNFFYVYATAGKAGGGNVAAGNDLTGAGFTSGTRILTGYVSALSSSTFTATNAVAQFDQFGTNNYPGISTVVGSGATDITVTITSANAAYFPDLATQTLSFSFFNTSQVDPFRQVNPSRAFSSNGITSANRAPSIGTVNGAGVGRGGGNDFQFQADANQSFLASSVPEPSSLALMGLALSAIGLVRRRRR